MSALYALDPAFIGIVYAIMFAVFGTILLVGLAVLVIEAVAEAKIDRRFRQRQRVRLPAPRMHPFPMAVAA